MTRILLAFIVITIGNTAFAGGHGVVDTSKSPHVKLRSLPMEDVKWTTGFWADPDGIGAGPVLSGCRLPDKRATRGRGASPLA
jgi:hypothetical protein